MWERRMWKQIDWWLLIAMVLLQCLGLITLASATYSSGWTKVSRQAVWMVFGWFAFVFALRSDHQLWARWSPWIHRLNVALLVALLLWGHEQYGAQRWLKLGSITLQPSEFAKAALVLSLASLIVENRERLLTDFWVFVRIGLHALLPIVLVFLQPDLGTSLVLTSIWFGMMFFVGVPIRWLVVTVLIGLTIFSIGWHKGVIKDYQKQRLTAFVDPYSRANKEGYHIIQSQLAIGSGGLTGKGLFKGRMGKLGFVPAQHTDFIFTVVGEEGGFIGACSVVLLYAILLWRLLTIMVETENVFGALVLAGTFCFFVAHIFVNIGMTLRLMPITGLPLPFFSLGGSNLLVCYLLLGIAQSIAARRKRLLFS
ncbi:MAG: rod shape-determining protein RodA [Candidatus Fervidibacter sp.]|uniref:rod shape-determining protein RodA n=1 Tax=Candidatus Fervidibacter sp. TaxID=3100871 RepID=UPI00404A8D10